MNRMKQKKVLNICDLIAFVSVMYTIVTLGQAVIHTDTATSNRFFNSIINNKQILPQSWNFNNGEVSSFWFPAIIQAIIQNAIISRVVTSAVVLAVCCIGILWLSKSFFKDDSYTITIPLLMVFACGFTYNDMVFFESAYTKPLLLFTFVFGLAYILIFEGEKNIKYALVLGILLFANMIPGIRNLAEFVIPFIGAIGVLWLLQIKKRGHIPFDGVIRALIYVGIPVVVGYLTYKFIYTTHEAHMYSTNAGTLSLNFHFSEFAQSIGKTFTNLFSLFGFEEGGVLPKNVLAAVISVSVFLILPILQFIDYKNLTDREKAFTWFAAFHNGLMLFVIIFGNKLYDRYLITSIFVAAIVSGNYVYRKIFAGEKNKVAVLFLIVFFILTIVYSCGLLSTTVGWKEKVQRQKDECKMLTDKGITKVYGEYWIAYPHEIYSDNKITAGAINIRPRILQKYYILSDDVSYEKKEGRSCILMTAEEAENCFGAVYVMCGQQDEDFVIKDALVSDNGHYYTTDLVAFVFNEDIGDRLSDEFRDGVIDIKEMDFNWYGTITEDAIILEKDGMVHGPFAYLGKGHYSVSINGNNLVGCNCAIVSEISPENVECTVTSIEENEIKMDLTLLGGIEDLQVYLSNTMDDKVAEFYNITVEKL